MLCWLSSSCILFSFSYFLLHSILVYYYLHAFYFLLHFSFSFAFHFFYVMFIIILMHFYFYSALYSIITIIIICIFKSFYFLFFIFIYFKSSLVQYLLVILFYILFYISPEYSGPIHIYNTIYFVKITKNQKNSLFTPCAFNLFLKWIDISQMRVRPLFKQISFNAMRV